MPAPRTRKVSAGYASPTAASASAGRETPAPVLRTRTISAGYVSPTAASVGRERTESAAARERERMESAVGDATSSAGRALPTAPVASASASSVNEIGTNENSASGNVGEAAERNDGIIVLARRRLPRSLHHARLHPLQGLETRKA
ncbi:hypothetical protein K438DRAFT_1789456 [Mycena galopus ATCC 62051]|nr:hypothetical protein K438DRAFT_1789456 [Mycena galopus ATCC 62051]